VAGAAIEIAAFGDPRILRSASKFAF
jgi:hypothetical protein